MRHQQKSIFGRQFYRGNKYTPSLCSQDKAKARRRKQIEKGVLKPGRIVDAI